MEHWTNNKFIKVSQVAKVFAKMADTTPGAYNLKINPKRADNKFSATQRLIDLHILYRFIGELEESYIKQIKEEIKFILMDYEYISLSIKQIKKDEARLTIVSFDITYQKEIVGRINKLFEVKSTGIDFTVEPSAMLINIEI